MKEGIEIIKRWTYKGRDCIVLKGSFGQFCAYVETNLVGVGYSRHEELSPESCISAHGGITYAGSLNDCGISETKPWYFGIDFAHFNDYVEFPGISKVIEGHVWTIEEVQKECECLVDGIIRYEERYEEILKLKTRHENEIAELKKRM